MTAAFPDIAQVRWPSVRSHGRRGARPGDAALTAALVVAVTQYAVDHDFVISIR
jgi:hypothetical protein